MLQTFDFKEKSKGLSWLCHRAYQVDRETMVHFSDESKFNLFGSDGKRFVRRKNGEHSSHQCIKKMMKFGGGSVMVWRMISSVGVGPISW